MSPAIPAQATSGGENGRIAFRRFLNEDRTWGAVFTIRPDGRGERQVTHPPPGFDGRKIVAGRRPETAGNADIFIVRADGTPLRNITNSTLYDSYPDWGPRTRH